MKKEKDWVREMGWKKTHWMQNWIILTAAPEFPNLLCAVGLNSNTSMLNQAATNENTERKLGQGNMTLHHVTVQSFNWSMGLQ